jgi:hypothetical protein
MGPVEVALAAGWLVISALATLSVIFYLRGLGPAPADGGPFPPVLVLLPVRAATDAEASGVAGCLAAVAAQDYPGPWRCVVAFEDAADPAFPIAATADSALFATVVAGPTPGRAQKLQNLLAALRQRQPEERIVVTLDADTRPAPDWLTDLTRAIRHGRAEAASGYRWPLGENFPGRLLALADRAPATLMRPRWLNMAWGGSTALSAAALDAVDLPKLWDAAVSDDLTLSAALKRVGLDPWTPRRVLVPTPLRPSWRATFGFGVRQYRLLRLHAPRLWWLFGAILAVPAIAAAALLTEAAQGSVAALAVIGVGVALQQWRASLRAEVARRVLPADAAEAVARGLWLDRLLLPLLPLLHLPIFCASAFGRRIAWGGRVYDVAAPDSVRVVPASGEARRP